MLTKRDKRRAALCFRAAHVIADCLPHPVVRELLAVALDRIIDWADAQPTI